MRGVGFEPTNGLTDKVSYKAYDTLCVSVGFSELRLSPKLRLS